jgi:hypothetical protein
MRRITEVKDRAERGFPIIIHAGFQVATPGVVLHISKRVGRINSRAGYEKGIHITQCSRVAEDWHVWSGKGYGEWNPREIVKAVEHPEYNFRFCTTCGTPADFQAAINGYWEHRDEEAIRRNAREEELAALISAQWTAQEAELQLFLYNFVTPDAPLEREGSFSFAYRVPNSGVVIKITADWEDE